MKKILENLEEKLTKKLTIVIFIVIIALQLLTRVYVGNKKEYFHMDEMYSYGLMNYNKININDNEDFYNQWHTKEYYQDYLEVNKDEVWDFSPVYENQKNDVHPPLFYLLLRVASTFTIDNFSKWTGIGLNMILFVFSNILVYFITKKLSNSRVLALLTCILNGFAFISLETTLYIRMYALANLSILLLTYTQLCILEKKELKLIHCIPIMIALLMGGLTHYHFFIYAFVVYIMYTVKCIREKNWRNLVKYNVAMIIAAVIYLLIFPYAINHVFFGYRGLGGGNDTGYFLKIAMFLEIMVRNLSGYAVVAIPFIIYIMTRKKTKIETEKQKSNIDWLVIPIIAFFLIVAKNAPYIELRYLIPIGSVVIISTVYLIWKYLKQYFTIEKTIVITCIFCILMILTPFVIGMKLDFTYSKFNHIADIVKEKNLPIIYLLDTSKNRFLDDLYLFTLTDRSIIIDSNDFEKFKDEIHATGHYIFMCNDADLQGKVVDGKKAIYLQYMNACHVWEVEE